MLVSAFNDCFSNKSLLSETSIYTKQVIETCYDCIDEGVNDITLLKTSSTYTQSLVLEILENVKETLLKVYQNVLSALNNYFLNTAVLADKYRKIIIDRYYKLDHKIIYKTYEYTNLFKLPKDVRSTFDVEKDAQDIVNMGLSSSYDNNKVSEKVDKYIQNFAKSVLGATVNLYDIKQSARDVSESLMRGREVNKTLTEADLDTFIDEIKRYRELKDEINSTKIQIIKYYNTLKSSFTSAFKLVPSDNIGVLQRAQDPEGSEVLDKQFQQYSQANIQLTRLFDSYINIYNAAFGAKLSLLQEKVQNNRDTLVELMTQTSVFAAVHAKHPDRNRTPIKPENEKIKM